MPQLDPTWFASQLFWLAVSFMLLYVVLAKFVLPPLQDVISRRAAAVSSDLEQAQVMKSQAEHERADYEKLMMASRERAQQTIANAMAKLKTKSEADGRAMDKQVEQKLAEAAERIHAKKLELKEALTPTAADLTSMIVEKIMQYRPQDAEIKQALAAASKGRA